MRDRGIFPPLQRHPGATGGQYLTPYPSIELCCLQRGRIFALICAILFAFVWFGVVFMPVIKKKTSSLSCSDGDNFGGTELILFDRQQHNNKQPYVPSYIEEVNPYIFHFPSAVSDGAGKNHDHNNHTTTTTGKKKETPILQSGSSFIHLRERASE